MDEKTPDYTKPPKPLKKRPVVDVVSAFINANRNRIDHAAQIMEDLDADKSVTQSVTRSVSHSHGHSDGQSVSHSVTHSKRPIFSNLHPTKMKILKFIFESKRKSFQYVEMEERLGIPASTIHNAVQQLVKCKLLEKRRYRDMSYQGVLFSIPPEVAAKIKKFGQSLGRSDGHSLDQSVGRSLGHSDRSVTRSVSQSLGHTIDDDDFLCINKDHHLPDDLQIKLLAPTLFEAGFRTKHLEEIPAIWSRNAYDLAHLNDNLEILEDIVSHDGSRIKEGIVPYCVASLKNGYISRRPGFKTRRETESERLNSAIERERRRIEREIPELAGLWWDSLTESERANVVSKIPGYEKASEKSRTILRQSYFETCVLRSATDTRRAT